MTRPEYERYLRSPHWRRLRKRYRQERPWRCGICTSTDRLELHHKTYERVGTERLSDLVPLCQACHSLLHQLVTEGQATLDPRSAFDRNRARKRTGREREDKAALAARNAQIVQARAVERRTRAKGSGPPDNSRRLRKAIARHEQAAKH